MNLEDLKPSITILSFTNQLNIHEAIRVSRLIPKQAPTKAAAKRKRSFGAIKKLSPEQAKELLRQLELDVVLV